MCMCLCLYVSLSVCLSISIICLTAYTNIVHTYVCLCIYFHLIFQKPQQGCQDQKYYLCVSQGSSSPGHPAACLCAADRKRRFYSPSRNRDWSPEEISDFLKTLRKSGMGTRGLFLLPLLLSSKGHLC